MEYDLDVFKREWSVTHIRPCERDGVCIGFEISLFLPLYESSSDADYYYGYAKSIFVKDVGKLIIGDTVKLGFSKKYKKWYIK